MNGLIAVVDFSGSPVDPALLGRVAAVLGGPPSGAGRWIDGAVALVACHHPVTAEGARERQPHAAGDGSARIVFDGRLDNRDELADALRAEGFAPREDTDVELALRAYEAWRDRAPARLLGDFAFVVWNARSRSLFAARDVLGLRPLYYHASTRFVAVASEIAPLLQLGRVRPVPNDGFVGECLTGQMRHRVDTVWRDILRLPPAHRLVATATGLTTDRFWQPDPLVELRYHHDDEYAEHLADLLKRATRARLRRSGPVGVMVSGGLDSSSVLGAIHAVRSTGDEPVRTYSVVEPGAAWDESAHVDAVVARWPVVARRLKPYGAASSYYAAQAATYRDLPTYPNGAMAHSLLAAAKDDGVGVLLTGIWSDEWFGASTVYYADLLRRLRLMTAWRHYRAQSGAGGFQPASMFRAAIWPLVPRSARERIKQLLGRDGVPAWIDRRFARSVDLAARIRPPAAEVRFPTLAQTELYQAPFEGWSLHGIELERRVTASFGIETRHPFGDRRIMEFALAIPEEQRWRGQRTKYIVRNAARRWLPDAILRRVDSPSPLVVMVNAIRQEFATGRAPRASARCGWIDPAALQRAYDEFLARYNAGDTGYLALLYPLWLTCAVDIWARTALEEN